MWNYEDTNKEAVGFVVLASTKSLSTSAKEILY